MTRPDPAGAAGQSWAAGSQRRVVIVVIGLAVVARLARDSRSYEPAIVMVIALAAVAGIGRASRSRSFARLAAWDNRRKAKELAGLAAR